MEANQESLLSTSGADQFFHRGHAVGWRRWILGTVALFVTSLAVGLLVTGTLSGTIDHILLTVPVAFSSQQPLKLKLVVHYPSEIISVCPGGLSVASSIDGFRRAAPLNPASGLPDVFEATLKYNASQIGTEAMLSLMLNAGLYEPTTPPPCSAICPEYSTAGDQSWGPKKRVTLPAEGGIAELWPTFCQVKGKKYVQELWSESLQRPFNCSVFIPPSENRLPRPEGEMPSILIRLDGQFFWSMMPDNGDLALSGLSLSGLVKEIVFIDIDFSLDGNPMWRHPYLVPTQLKGCPSRSAALDKWPSLAGTWANYFPSYLKLNSTYGFGKADALLSFLFDEMLPDVVHMHFPKVPGNRQVRFRDLDVGLWGISDAGYTAWYGVWARPGDFDVALMQTPLTLWNCAEALDEVQKTGYEWVRRARAGEFGARLPRFYMDHGTQEDPMAYTVPTEALYSLLRHLGFQDGRDVFLMRGEGDGHFDSAFYMRAWKALLALYGTEGNGFKYQEPRPSSSWL